ncbi:MAG: endolytic transglycosylase MltG [Bacteroidetes bacterium]|nr:endolytic transglycosylase MltG [Bacteroidota bacterium]
MIKKLILFILVIIITVAAYFGFMLLKPSVSNKQDVFFYVHTGDDLATVKSNLINQNFINGKGFDLACKILRFTKPKAGRYKISDGMSNYSLIRILRSGNQAEVKLTINKERTPELFAGKFGKKYDFEFDSLQMINFLHNTDSLKKYGVDTNTVMAIVMPYTYSLKWNSTPEKVYQQFYNTYQTFWTQERKIKADSLHLTPIQVITLASIVDEETLKKSDKGNIASTYLNRIRVGMPLQADPTIKYAMRDFSLKRILSVHLKTISPYNTYLNRGLPPGPICTPQPETIDAVLNAPKTEYLYFVASSNFDGSSIFTTNYNDHLKYAHLYQQELTRRMDSTKKANQEKNVAVPENRK